MLVQVGLPSEGRPADGAARRVRVGEAEGVDVTCVARSSARRVQRAGRAAADGGGLWWSSRVATIATTDSAGNGGVGVSTGIGSS